MEKTLKLYFNDGTAVAPFPSGMEHAEIFDFSVSISRMGEAPSISAKLEYPVCLDGEWGRLCRFNDIFVEFKGERYYLKSTPSSEKRNDSPLYTHDLVFVCERDILGKVYMIDDNENQTQDIIFSNNAQFTFFGNVDDFAERINQSMYFSGIGDSCMYSGGEIVPIGQRTQTGDGYYIVVDEGVHSEEMLVTFSNSKVSEAIAQIYSVFGIPYYFVGRTIHIGDFRYAVETDAKYAMNGIVGAGIEDGQLVPYEYGHANSMLSVGRSNVNKEVFNRCSGKGSEDNIPYYYPNPTPSGTIRHEVDGSTITDNDVTIIDQLKFSSLNENDSIKYVFSQISSTDHIMEKGIYEDDILYKGPHFVSFPLDDIGTGGNVYHGISIRVRVDFDVKKEYSLIGLNFHNQFPSGTQYVVTRPDGVTISGRGSFCNLTPKQLMDTDRKYVLGKYSISFDIPLEPEHPNQESIFFDLSRLEADIYYDNPEQAQQFRWFGEISQNTRYWSLESNGAKVNLEDYGILIDDSANPVNGDKITKVVISYITPQKNLMPSCYRLSGGNKKFYPARNYPIVDVSQADTEIGDVVSEGKVENDNYKGEGGLYYHFDNEMRRLKQSEHIEDFSDIKPTIKGITNANGQRIDMFSEIAFDENDDNSGYFDDNGNFVYNHPFFFVKLRVFDGQNGFNLFDHTIDESEMKISLTSGSCAPCEFTIKVDDKQKNTVQVDEDGNLLRDEDGDVMCGRKGTPVVPQDRQNDTNAYSVWIALEKDIETYGEIMPYNQNGVSIRPQSCSSESSNDGDSFVILHIDLPIQYVTAAEQRLTKEIIRWMNDNNEEKFNMSLKFSKVFIGDNADIEPLLSENIKVRARYNGVTKDYFVSTYSYRKQKGSPFPDIELSGLVETTEELKAMTSSGGLERRIGQHIAENFDKIMSGSGKPFTRIIKSNNASVENQIKGSFPTDYPITKGDLQNGSIILGAGGRYIKVLIGGSDGDVISMVNGMPMWAKPSGTLKSVTYTLKEPVKCNGNQIKIGLSHQFEEEGVYYISANIQFEADGIMTKGSLAAALILNDENEECSCVTEVVSSSNVCMTAIVNAKAGGVLDISVNSSKNISVVPSFSINGITYGKSTNLNILKLY